MYFLLALLVLLFGCKQDYAVVNTVETVGELGYDTFTTVDQAVDILFLVDQSGSMDDDIDRINLALPSIYTVLTGSEFTNLEWRVGIRSMDLNESIPAYVDWNDDNADLKLLTLTSYLSQWGGEEAGLDAAVTSLAWDKGFYRTDADLLFIFLSDEEDQSTISIDSYLSFMEQVKQEPFIVTESAIVTTEESTCTSGGSVGTGYIDVSEVVTDICDTDTWVNTLTTVKDHLPSISTSFALTQVPVSLSDIRVFINTEETFDWEYNRESNTVILDTPPVTDSTVEVVYLIK